MLRSRMYKEKAGPWVLTVSKSA